MTDSNRNKAFHDHIVEFTRDLSFCAILVAAGTKMITMKLFFDVPLLSLILGTGVIIIGFFGVGSVVGHKFHDIFKQIRGWKKVVGFVFGSVITLAAIGVFGAMLTYQLDSFFRAPSVH